MFCVISPELKNFLEVISIFYFSFFDNFNFLSKAASLGQAIVMVLPDFARKILNGQGSHGTILVVFSIFRMPSGYR